jgi:uncharacterized coiled-coil DUF342 family protein
MLSDSEIQSLLSQLEALKTEATNLKKEISLVSRQKEAVFTKRHELGIEIRKHIGAIRQERTQRDSLTKEVKLSKGEREDASTKIRTLLDELHKLQDARKAMIAKSGVEDDPGELKNEMRRLERTIETGAISFEREKKLMVEIKKLKKKYDAVKAADVHADRIRTIKKELDDLRRLSENAHQSVQDRAHKSQEFHEAILTESKEIDGLKDKENEFTKQYEEFKLKIKDISDQLDQKQQAMDGIRKQLQESHVELKEEQSRSAHEILRKKEQIVEEKIQKKQKLTTEDLLVFQRLAGSNHR